MHSATNFVQINFAREWRVRRPFVYRYLEKTYVEQFFADGSLRLSSFAIFSAHKDEERQDATEGQGSVIVRRGTGDVADTLMMFGSQGHDAYVLCGAAQFSLDLAASFRTDSGFRINNSAAFADAISRHVAGFFGGQEGPCLYVSDKTVQRHTSDKENSPSAPDFFGSISDIQQMFDRHNAAQPDELYYLKNQTFAHQNEYRMLWLVPGRVHGHIDIRCPEARQFCTPFERLLAENPSV